jgi:hypothetical protein
VVGDTSLLNSSSRSMGPTDNPVSSASFPYSAISELGVLAGVAGFALVYALLVSCMKVYQRLSPPDRNELSSSDDVYRPFVSAPAPLSVPLVIAHAHARAQRFVMDALFFLVSLIAGAAELAMCDRNDVL